MTKQEFAKQARIFAEAIVDLSKKMELQIVTLEIKVRADNTIGSQTIRIKPVN